MPKSNLNKRRSRFVDLLWRYDLTGDLKTTAECRLCGHLIGPKVEIWPSEMVKHTLGCVRMKGWNL